MKDTFKNALLAQVKDYGLSDKAINELIEQGSTIIAEDATEEMVKQQVNLFANIARSMQSEVTRKVQAAAKSQSEKQPKVLDEGKVVKDGDGVKQPQGSQDNLLLEKMAALEKQLDDLQKANKQAAAAKAEESRVAIVKEAAKKAELSDELLGIIDTSKITTAEEADKLFSVVRQQMVNDKLRPKGAGGIKGTSSEADKSEAEAWAKALPDAK